jgi:hypothetical protein
VISVIGWKVMEQISKLLCSLYLYCIVFERRLIKKIFFYLLVSFTCKFIFFFIFKLKG